MLKKTIIALVLMTTTALADYNLIVPQKPSGGTSVWAQIVVAEWEKHLGEKINLIYKPGARDQLGPNEFQNKLFKRHKTRTGHTDPLLIYRNLCWSRFYLRGSLMLV